MDKLQQTCCFFGHRTINYTDDLITKLTESIEKLITEKKVDMKTLDPLLCELKKVSDK